MRAIVSNRLTPQRPLNSNRRKLRVLAVTRIFPNQLEPLAATYQRQQLAALAKTCSVRVFAVLPYLVGSTLFGRRTRAGRLAAVPLHEEIDGLSVLHPRAPYVPGAGSFTPLAPMNMPLYLRAILPYARELGQFDVVLGTYLYPDACAAGALAERLGVPYAIKTHGTDVNTVSHWPSIQRIVRPSLAGAAWAMGPSGPLVRRLIELGAHPDRSVVLPNGVDRRLFHPRDRAEMRKELGLPTRGRLVVYVGRVEREKGVRELHDAFERMEATRDGGEPIHLVIAGFGGMEDEMRRAAARNEALAGGPRDHRSPHREGARLLVFGGQPPEEIAKFIGAADVVALPSWAEGMPNTILEALACGRPCVATNVGGIPDALTPACGVLVPPRDVPSLTAALRSALARRWDERAILAASPPSWEESAAKLHDLLEQAVFPGRTRRGESEVSSPAA
jgi:teichuronic acid biosynthesis glycosyltransferase TuaC